MADISIWRAVWDDDQSMFLWREKTRYLKAVVIFFFFFYFRLCSAFIKHMLSKQDMILQESDVSSSSTASIVLHSHMVHIMLILMNELKKDYGPGEPN